MLKRKLGLGTLSLLLSIIGVVWAFTFRGGICIGDNVLNYLGLKAWSNGNTGIHFTIHYSLIFFIPAFFMAVKYNDDFGAKVGKTVSMAVGIFIILSVFGLTL